MLLTTRRWAGLVLTVLLLPACSALDSSVPALTGLAPGDPSALQVFAPWPSGPEAAAVAALHSVYRAEHPGATVANPAAVATPVADPLDLLKYQLLNGDPLDVLGGVAVGTLNDTYASAGLVAPLDDLYRSEGWERAFPPALSGMMQARDHHWAVPVSVRRGSLLWYNKAVFAKNGLQPPTTFADFFKVAEVFKAQKLPALALGNHEPTTSAQLFETVLLGTLGADAYNGLWTNHTHWDDPRVTAALATCRRLLEYEYFDHAHSTWQEADDLLIQGKAGMLLMDDRVVADFQAKGFTDYGWLPAPGTAGLFDTMPTVFALPKTAAHPAAARAWLHTAGSVAGQVAYAAPLGALPARRDAAPVAGNAYLQAAHADWQTATLVPSATSGAAVGSAWTADFITAADAFVNSGNTTAATAAFVQACSSAGICPPLTPTPQP
ncbi:MAG: ABC transporter substrate-binding protein [Chloroflexota bacterium]|nr:ABC transporter substrate-binding protein [Chloroflexota bacterium]